MFYGILWRQYPSKENVLQILVPAIIRPQVLRCGHHARNLRHPDQTSMFYSLRNSNYCPSMTADVSNKVWNFYKCSKKRVRLKLINNPMFLFPSTGPLQFISLNLFSSLTKNHGFPVHLGHLLPVLEADPSGPSTNNRCVCGLGFLRRTLAVQIRSPADCYIG